MAKKLLIDATHDEETRVAIVENGKLEEFDYESAMRKPLKGNIFLAKITRVEPSLQAAFVNYGGNRHGFIPFSEIHPDYFRIPIADREALMAEQEELIAEEERKTAAQEEKEDAQNAGDKDADAEKPDEVDTDAEAAQDDAAEDAEAPKEKAKPKRAAKKSKAVEKVEAVEEPAQDPEDAIGNTIQDEDEDPEDSIGNKAAPEESDEEQDEKVNGNADQSDNNNNRGGRGRGRRGGRGRGRGRDNNNNRGGRGRNSQHRSKRSEKYDDEDFSAEQRFRQKLRYRYKIQEVIKRGQIMLVQISKEERGNKGAAGSTYLSLPGRYCVLMPNSPRGGGVSRKIANYKDRARMRDVMKGLEIPKGMSVILRTAGVERTKAEIKRDLDYLMRLWNNIRELTLESSAPSEVYEEADLVKRTVRDSYTRDVEEVWVAGEEGYNSAKSFMKMMIPSHVKKVKEHTDDSQSLFNKFGVEGQIAEIGETTVTLPSGGYLVINPTEALVSVDVNSGKATKQRHIEETALHTNLEAAEEVARQLRLRDLGGLVVIDFIDMEERRNNGKVERRMRDSLSGDRARVQVGRISSFGLMELSRQRLNPSLGESQFKTCDACEGTGRVRTADAASIMVLRALEKEGMKGRAAEVIVHVSAEVAQYILNHKRNQLSGLEKRFGIIVLLRIEEMSSGNFRVEVSKPSDGRSNGDGDAAEDGKGGRRRRSRGGRGRNRKNTDETNSLADALEENEEDNAAADNDAKDSSEEKKPRRSRNRRPKRNEEKSDDSKGEEKSADAAPEAETEAEAPKKPRGRAKKVDDKAVVAEAKTEAKDDKPSEDEKPKKKPASRAKKVAKSEEAPASNDDQPKAKATKKVAPEERDYETVNEAPKTKKKGWWSKG